MELENLEIYEISMELSDKIWTIVTTWKYFEKDTIGKQWVRAADSVSANIGEGFGRFHYKDSKHFYYFARGSLYETKTWTIKAKQRNLIESEDFQQLETEIKNLTIKLNKFIKIIGQKTNHDNE
jgi:four helix bundle protein